MEKQEVCRDQEGRMRRQKASQDSAEMGGGPYRAPPQGTPSSQGPTALLSSATSFPTLRSNWNQICQWSEPQAPPREKAGDTL